MNEEAQYSQFRHQKFEKGFLSIQKNFVFASSPVWLSFLICYCACMRSHLHHHQLSRPHAGFAPGLVFEGAASRGRGEAKHFHFRDRQQRRLHQLRALM